MSPLLTAGHGLEKGLAEAGVGLDDMSLVETHDCFTIAELIQYEAMGLAEAGKGAQALNDGTVYKDGKLPVNPSGGLKAKGHPVGATGVSMHVMAARQLMDDAGEMQVKDATLAGCSIWAARRWPIICRF